jgi:hypothetical protein
MKNAAKSIVGFLFLFIASCAMTPLERAVSVSNGTGELLKEAQPILHETCTLPMEKASKLPEAQERVQTASKIAERCDTPMATYDALRSVHVQLVATLVLVTGGGVKVSDLIKLTDEVFNIGLKFAQEFIKP